MKIIGFIFGVVCLIAMLIAFIPLLGWLNWIVIPLAVVGLIISSLVNSRSGKTMCIVVIIFGIFRLIFGGGLF